LGGVTVAYIELDDRIKDTEYALIRLPYDVRKTILENQLFFLKFAKRYVDAMDEIRSKGRWRSR